MALKLARGESAEQRAFREIPGGSDDSLWHETRVHTRFVDRVGCVSHCLMRTRP